MNRFLLDVNVLVSLSLPRHIHHRAASTWFATVSAWATTPITEAGYVRLTSNVRVAGYAIAPMQAVQALETMRRLSEHAFVPDDATLASPVVDLGPMVGHSQVTDFHLLDLAARHQLTLATFDGSFVRSLREADRRHVHLLKG